MAKFVTDASGATWWPNLEPMQVAFFLLAEEITQVKEAIPWIRCASGNVFKNISVLSLTPPGESLHLGDPGVVESTKGTKGIQRPPMVIHTFGWSMLYCFIHSVGQDAKL